MAKEILGTKGEAMSKKEEFEQNWRKLGYTTTKTEGLKNDLWAWIEEEVRQARSEALEDAVNCFPTTWLDNMLSGDRAVMGAPPFYCPDIEKLLTKIKDNINQLKGD